jgi:hypothetical protein
MQGGGRIAEEPMGEIPSSWRLTIILAGVAVGLLAVLVIEVASRGLWN